MKIFVFISWVTFSLTANAFMNPMKMMSGGPANMMTQMCGNPMGNAAAGMMNSMSQMASFTPMGGMTNGMKNGISADMMVEVLNNPQSTLRAIDCAQRSQDVVRMMLETLHSHPQLMSYLGGAMYLDSHVAKSMMNLALMNPRVGGYLFANMDPMLFKQVTHALARHPGMVRDVVTLVSQHPYALQPGSNFMRVMTDWGSTARDSDGVEMAVERFLWATFSDSKAANDFMNVVAQLDNASKTNLLNILFLGKVANYYYYNEEHRWADATFENQSYFNLYAMIQGLRKSLIRGANTSDAAEEKADDEARTLMHNMMEYMIDPVTKRPTAWGMQLMATLLAGSQVHHDAAVSEFAKFLMDLMPPKFSEGLAHVKPNSFAPAPREFLKLDPPQAPQMLDSYR